MRNKKRKLDAVRKACKSHGLSTIALFRKAWQEKFGDLDSKAVRLAHSAYQKAKKKIPAWVRSYIVWLNQPRAAMAPA